MLNIVTEEKGGPCAVLIRALEPVGAEVAHRNFDVGFRFSREGPHVVKKSHRRSQCETSQNLVGFSPRLPRIASGPGKLCQWLEIDGSFNGEDLVKSKKLWIENRGVKMKSDQIVAAKRIGVDYAGVWKDKKWRFYIKNNLYVSKK